MDNDTLLYDMIKEIKQDIKTLDEKADKNTEILVEHQRRSIASEKRLDLLEERAVQINWKTVGIITGSIASLLGCVYTIIKILESL